MVRVKDDLSKRGKVLSTCDKGMRLVVMVYDIFGEAQPTAVTERRGEALMASDGRGVHGIKAVRPYTN
jgi:hypothetical protein